MKNINHRRHNVYLIGFSGSGKTSVAPILAKLCKMGMLDMDEEIERRSGKSIIEIFNCDGEPKFRSTESSVLRDVANSKNSLVVATGGGVPTKEKNRKIMSESGIIVRLNVTTATIEERLSKDSDTRRPMLDVTTAESLMQARELSYSIADISVDTDCKTPEEIAQLIASELRQFDNG